MAELPADPWNALAGDQPCLQHAFLAALEDSGAVGGDSGWQPHHATLWADGALIAAMPLYEKLHSWGEYVFDWAWAQAYEQHGLDYYPKWLSAIPFTPVPGRRLLGVSAAVRTRLLSAVMAWIEAGSHGSFHVLFPGKEDARVLANAGLMIRQGAQFHWRNAGYADFDAFLASLTRDKRKKIRQERRRVRDAGVSLHWRRGDEMTPDELAFFHLCYRLTYARHRSTPYLSEAFFATLAQRQPDAVRLLIAERNGAPVAAAWFLIDARTLYGRYWGAVEDIPCLHFEACYYQAIEYAIDHGLVHLEGGAQGEHKLARGFTPQPTRSAHWLRDPRFADAVARFLEQESGHMDAWIDELNERTPFRPA